jgi:YesN/AraC family two-component response regulator
VDEISYRLGYRNMESFIRMFKKIVGMTPTGYRESAACNNSPEGGSN